MTACLKLNSKRDELSYQIMLPSGFKTEWVFNRRVPKTQNFTVLFFFNLKCLAIILEILKCRLYTLRRPKIHSNSYDNTIKIKIYHKT